MLFTCCNYLLHYLQHSVFVFFSYLHPLSAAAAMTLFPPEGLFKFHQIESDKSGRINSWRGQCCFLTLTWAPPCRWPEPERWSPSCPLGRCRAGCRLPRKPWTPWRCGPCDKRSWFGKPSTTGLQMTEWSTWSLWGKEDNKPILSLLPDLLYRGVIGA